jgi:hypothetical protein
MQRVSTAFVGQVSAASRPANAKLKGRARATNDPAYVPLASSHRAQSRRRRDLVAIFFDALGGRAAVSELQLVQVRKAAELTTAAKAVRARVLAGDATADLDALVKLEGEARRAVRALGILSSPPHVSGTVSLTRRAVAFAGAKPPRLPAPTVEAAQKSGRRLAPHLVMQLPFVVERSLPLVTFLLKTRTVVRDAARVGDRHSTCMLRPEQWPEWQRGQYAHARRDDCICHLASARCGPTAPRLIARAHAEWPFSLLSALPIPVLGKLVPCYNDFFKKWFLCPSMLRNSYLRPVFSRL